MKAEDMSITMFARFDEPDDMNGTTLSVNGRLAWPVYNAGQLVAPSIHESDTVVLDIPSGQLAGEIAGIAPRDDATIIYIRHATWAGRAGGLAGGLSGLGTFEVIGDGEVVESSTLPPGTEVSYFTYEQVRQLADFATGDNDKQQVMRRIFEVLGY